MGKEGLILNNTNPYSSVCLPRWLRRLVMYQSLVLFIWWDLAHLASLINVNKSDSPLLLTCSLFTSMLDDVDLQRARASSPAPCGKEEKEAPVYDASALCHMLRVGDG